VYLEKRMRQEYTAIDDDFPEFCRDPRCAAALGRMFRLNKMIYGSVAQNGNRYGVELFYIDVIQEKVAGRCSIEGAPGDSLSDVISDAVTLLTSANPRQETVSSNRYYGEDVENQGRMLISSGAWIATGLVWSLASTDWYAQDLYDTYPDLKEDLVGVNALTKDMPTSARAKAMGNAYVAVTGDAYGAFFNPAGVAWAEGPQGAVSYQSRFGMLDAVSASFVNKATREIGWGHTFQYTGSPDSKLQELYFGSIFSYKFNNLFGKLRPFSIGAKLHLASLKTTGSEGENAVEGSGMGIGLDIGSVIELSDRIDFGFLFSNVPYVTNFNTKAVTLSDPAAAGEQEYGYWEPQAPYFRLGGTFQVRYGTMFTAEGQMPLADEQAWIMAGGVEQRIFQYVLTRLGAYRRILADQQEPWHWTMGLGAEIPVQDKYIRGDVSYEINTNAYGGELRDVWDFSLNIEL
ncbi:MAG: hypothetical protein ACQEQV_04590, partial [Fibrobacterota bacterium]